MEEKHSEEYIKLVSLFHNNEKETILKNINELNDKEGKDILEVINKNMEILKMCVDIIKSKNKNKIKKEENYKEYTKEEVYTILENNSYNINKLITMYSKKELSSMYYSLYKVAPLTNKNKEDIASRIRLYRNRELRAETLARL